MIIKRTTFAVLITLLLTCIATAQSPAEKGLQVINKNTLESQLDFFSSNWFEGREATTKGAFMAADYLASLYKGAGLHVAGEDSTFFQTVPLTIFSASKETQFIVTNGNKSIPFKCSSDYIAPVTAQSFQFDAPVIWGGYGINSKTFSEFSPKHTKGKILIRIKGLPEGATHSDFTHSLTSKSEQEINQLKNTMAREAGAIAILEFDQLDPFLKRSACPTPIETSQAPSEKKLTKHTSGIYKKNIQLRYATNQSLPVFKVSMSIMQSLIPDFAEQLKSYNHSLKKNKVTPVNTAVTNIQLSMIANSEYKTCRNVLAMIEGSEYPDEIIVVGAHYDHLGKYDGYIWNGADDNGSGAIGVVTIAKAFMATGIQPKRTVIFANWTAEERGLLGSTYFVDQYQHIKQVKYYHNYDMIGRSYHPEKPDSAVSLLYTESWKAAEDLSDQFNKEYNLGLKINFSPWDNPVGGSDNAPFARQGIPIMWFHTGGHPDYHMPSDHADKIDWQKLEGIVKTSFLTLWELANE